LDLSTAVVVWVAMFGYFFTAFGRWCNLGAVDVVKTWSLVSTWDSITTILELYSEYLLSD